MRPPVSIGEALRSISGCFLAKDGYKVMVRPRGKEKTSDNVCIHYEDIDEKNIGTCRYCGQVKKYPFPWESEPAIILKPGRTIMSEVKSPVRKRRGKLTPKQKTELLLGGIEAFCQKYGYEGKAKSGIKLAHDRIRDALTALAGAEPLAQPAEPPPAEFQLPEILKAALELLPPAGTVLSEERKDAIKAILNFAIDQSLSK